MPIACFLCCGRCGAARAYRIEFLHGSLAFAKQKVGVGNFCARYIVVGLNSQYAFQSEYRVG